MSVLGECLFYIGPTPAEEPSAQLGEPDYNRIGRQECRAFIDQIRRQLGPEPAGVRLRTKTERHDFGAYYEVVAEVAPDASQPAVDWAVRCESEAPKTWDQEALVALGKIRP